MPFTREWDESAPPGSRPADQIDEAIQETKTDIRERLDEVLIDFPEGPVKVRKEAIEKPVFIADDRENRPPPAEADFFWAIDDKALFISDGVTWTLGVQAGEDSGSGGNASIVVVTAEDEVTALPESWSSNLVSIEVPIPFPVEECYPVTVKLRLRKLTESYPSRYTIATIGDVTDTPFSFVGVRNPDDELTGVIRHVRHEEGPADTSIVRVYPRIYNPDSGDSATAMVEITVAVATIEVEEEE